MALVLSPTRTIIRGDSDKFRITFAKPVATQNSNYTNSFCSNSKVKPKTIPIDITGWVIRFTVRPNVPESSIIDDTDALISEEAILADPINGVAIIYVKSETTLSLDPGVYLYDIQVTRPRDEYGFQEVSSIKRGKYVVVGDITRNQDITVVEDYDVAYDEVNGTVNVLNGNAEIDEDGNVLLSNATVLSDNDGDVVIGANRNSTVKSTTQATNTKRYTLRSTDNADDGYTI